MTDLAIMIVILSFIGFHVFAYIAVRAKRIRWDFLTLACATLFIAFGRPMLDTWVQNDWLETIIFILVCTMLLWLPMVVIGRRWEKRQGKKSTPPE